MQGRTKNSFSHVAIKLSSLLEVLGPNFNGDVLISRPWFEKLTRACDYVMVKRDSDQEEKVVDTKPASSVVSGARPEFIIE